LVEYLALHIILAIIVTVADTGGCIGLHGSHFISRHASHLISNRGIHGPASGFTELLLLTNYEASEKVRKYCFFGWVFLVLTSTWAEVVTVMWKPFPNFLDSSLSKHLLLPMIHVSENLIWKGRETLSWVVLVWFIWIVGYPLYYI